MSLEQKEAENLLEALEEWENCPNCGPKELEEDDIGLDSDRLLRIREVLVGQANNSQVCSIEYLETMLQACGTKSLDSEEDISKVAQFLAENL